MWIYKLIEIDNTNKKNIDIFELYYNKILDIFLNDNNLKKLIIKTITTKKILLLYGNNDINYLLNYFLKKNNYNFRNINNEELKDNYFKHNILNNQIYVINNIDNYLLNSDKDAILNLCKFNWNDKNFSIFFTCDFKHTKLIANIEKNVNIYRFKWI